MPRGAASKLSENRRKKFLEALARRGNVTQACQEIATSQHSVYSLRKRDPEFRKQWGDAIEVARERIESEAYRRAVEGYEEELHYMGRKTGDVVRKYSDKLLGLLLRGNYKDKYGNQTHEAQAGTPQGIVKIVFEANGREITTENNQDD